MPASFAAPLPASESALIPAPVPVPLACPRACSAHCSTPFLFPCLPQNLLYERQHYEKEIASCRSWQSAYSDEQVRACCGAAQRAQLSVQLLGWPAVLWHVWEAAGLKEHCARHGTERSSQPLTLAGSPCFAALLILKPTSSGLQIALIPLEEFSSHPLAAEGGLAEESDPHQLMLNRLKHEVAYRWEGLGQCGTIAAHVSEASASFAQVVTRMFGCFTAAHPGEAGIDLLHSDPSSYVLLLRCPLQAGAREAAGCGHC